jgi:type IV secretion system protein VirD4
MLSTLHLLGRLDMNSADPFIFYKFINTLSYSQIESLPLWYKAAVIFSFFSFFAILDFKKKKGKYGYAKLATDSDIKEMGLMETDGIILGSRSICKRDKSEWNLFDYIKDWVIKGGENRWIRFTGALSVLVLAPTGSGKTVSLVFPNMYFLKNSIILHDPKGEIRDKTINYRKTISKVIVFDPVKEGSSKFNPLCRSLLPKLEGSDNLDYTKLHDYIAVVGSTLMPTSGDAKGDFFNMTARNVFLFVTEWLCWKDGGTSLPEVFLLLTSTKNLSDTLDFMEKGIDPRRIKGDVTLDDILSEIEEDYNKRNLSLTPYFQKGHDGSEMPPAFINDLNSVTVSSGGQEQWAGVIGTLNQHLSIFSPSSKIITNNTSGESELLPLNFRKELTTLYVIVRDEDSDRLKGLLTLLFEVLGNTLLSTMPEENDHQITFLLDEFTRLGKLRVLMKMPEISRGYKVNGIYITQDDSQIEAAYDKNTVKTFDTNTSYKVYFGQNNDATAERISKAIGNKTDKRISSSEQKKGDGGSKSTSEEGLRLFTAQDIMNLPREKVLILKQNNFAKPIFTYSAFYENDNEIVSGYKKADKDAEDKNKALESFKDELQKETIYLPYIINLDDDSALVEFYEDVKSELEDRPVQVDDLDTTPNDLFNHAEKASLDEEGDDEDEESLDFLMEEAYQDAKAGKGDFEDGNEMYDTTICPTKSQDLELLKAVVKDGDQNG